MILLYEWVFMCIFDVMSCRLQAYSHQVQIFGIKKDNLFVVYEHKIDLFKLIKCCFFRYSNFSQKLSVK